MRINCSIPHVLLFPARTLRHGIHLAYTVVKVINSSGVPFPAFRPPPPQVRARSKYDERTQAAEIMDIPELEEEGKEDLTRVVRR